MSASRTSLFLNDTDREIEDVVNARKANGQYDIEAMYNIHPLRRYPFSVPEYSYMNQESRESLLEDVQISRSEGDLRFAPNVWSTDSEITIVRVKRENLQYKSLYSNWKTVHDQAVPGDGTHLAESPSMVNLVTLVPQAKANELMVPLSSWEPNDKPHEFILSSSLKARDAHHHTSSAPPNADDSVASTSALDNGGRGGSEPSRRLKLLLPKIGTRKGRKTLVLPTVVDSAAPGPAAKR